MRTVRKGGIYLMAAFYVALCGGCGKSPIPDPVSSPIVGVCKDISVADRAKLASAISKVGLGWQRSVIEGQIGRPDFDERLSTKETGRTMATMAYYFARKCGDRAKVEDGDVYIRLLYHDNGSLGSIESFGFDEIPHRSDFE
jgi:hypothetical protein